MGTLSEMHSSVLAGTAAALRRHDCLCRHEHPTPGYERSDRSLSVGRDGEGNVLGGGGSPSAEHHAPPYTAPTVAVIEGVAASFESCLSNLTDGKAVRSVYARNARLVPPKGPLPLLIDHDGDLQVGIVTELAQEGGRVRFRAELHLAKPHARETLERIIAGERSSVSLGFVAPDKIESFGWGFQVYKDIVPAEMSIVRNGADEAAYITRVDGEEILPPPHVYEREQREYRAQAEELKRQQAMDVCEYQAARHYERAHEDAMAAWRARRDNRR